MSNAKHPIEQLLRPAHETPVGLAYMVAAILVLMSPGVMLGAIHTPVLTYGLASALVLRGWIRLACAARLLKYQYELHVLPAFFIDSKDVPVSDVDLYLGLGFEWRARHTQRRTDIDRIEYDYHKYRLRDRQQAFMYKAARHLEDKANSFIVLPALARVTSVQHWLNPVAPVPYVEGDPSIHSVGLWEGEESIFEKQSERVAHKFVVGTTRVGKTRLAEVLIKQDIHNGEVVIVFDPKGDPDLLKRCYIEAKRAGRLHQFYCFHLGFPELSARYNPVGTFGRITEPATRIAGQLPGEGASAAFREFTWRYVNVMAKALTSLGQRVSYDALLKYGADMDPLLSEYLAFLMDQPAIQAQLETRNVFDWRQAVKNIVENPDIKADRTQSSRDRTAWATAKVYKEAGLSEPVADALIKTFEYEKSFYDKLVASLFPLLEKLTSGPAAELLSPNYLDDNDPRPIFDWDEIIRTGGIVYVGLDALSDADVSQAVGNSMFADLTSRAGAIYKGGHTAGLPPELAKIISKRKICIHADEFNELVGKEFVPMANKAGGAGFQLTVYTQTLNDIIARFGDKAKAGQVIGNLGNIIMLRVKDPDTAALLTDQLPQVEINQLTLVSGANDDTNPDTDTDFTSGTQQRITSQRVPMIVPGDIQRLPKGHAFALMGGKLYKLRLPQFKLDAEMPEGMNFLYSEMQKKYKSASNDLQWADLPEVQVAS